MGVEITAMARRTLRRLELEAYATVVSAFRAQGSLHKEKKSALALLCKHLGISNERHRAEIRRAVNDDLLSAVAGCISGKETDKLWRTEGQKIASTNPRFVSRQVTHLPQVLSSAAASTALGTQAGLKTDTELKKHTSARVQNALKFIISQNPVSRSQTTTPVKVPPTKQPPTPVKNNSSATPTKPVDTSHHATPVKTSTTTIKRNVFQVESVGTQTAIDVRTVSTSTFQSLGEQKIEKQAVADELVKRKPSSKLESLLCDESLASPAKQDASKSQDTTSKPASSNIAAKPVANSVQSKPVTSSIQAKPVTTSLPPKLVTSSVPIMGSVHPKPMPNIRAKQGTSDLTKQSPQSANKDVDTVGLKEAAVVKTSSDVTPPDQEPFEVSKSSTKQLLTVQACTDLKPIGRTEIAKQVSVSEDKASLMEVASLKPPTTLRLARKRSISPSTSSPPPPAKKPSLTPHTTQTITSPHNSKPHTPASIPPCPLTTVPILTTALSSSQLGLSSMATAIELASPELRHKPPPLTTAPVKQPSKEGLSEISLNVLLKQAESPATTPVLQTILEPSPAVGILSPVLHTPTTPGITIEDQTDLIQAICSDMSALEESVAISELADQLGLEPSQLSIPDFLHLIQPGIGSVESDPGITGMEPMIVQPQLLTDAGITPSSQTVGLPLSAKPSSLTLAQSLPPTPLLETPLSMFTPCEEDLQSIATPLSIITPTGDMMDLESLVGEGDELLEGIPEDIAETIQALVRLDEQTNAPWKQ